MDSRRRFMWSWRKAHGGLALLLVVVAVDWLIFGPRSTRMQHDVDAMLTSLPLPPRTAQAKYKSGYVMHRGYAERTLVSKETPSELCDFYLPLFKQDGWTSDEADCHSVAEHWLLGFYKQNLACGIHVGHIDGTDNYYVYYIRVDWAGFRGKQ